MSKTEVKKHFSEDAPSVNDINFMIGNYKGLVMQKNSLYQENQRYKKALEKISSREKLICTNGCKENCNIAPNCAIKLAKQALEALSELKANAN